MDVRKKIGQKTVQDVFLGTVPLTKTQDTHTLTKNRFHKIFFLALKSIVLRYPKK